VVEMLDIIQLIVIPVSNIIDGSEKCITNLNKDSLVLLQSFKSTIK
jgi:hypothetical protein